MDEWMDAPKVTTQYEVGGFERVDERARTRLIADVREEWQGAASGVARVQAYRSEDDEDRGGFVLRLGVCNGDGAMTPFVRTSGSDGVELHMCGDEEGAAMLKAMRQAIDKLMLQMRISVGRRE